jgi:S-adenosylhomocysteine hydrolase
VEITKQGVWRARDLPLAFPVLHCADSELKRLEAQRCGETVARCLDGAARSLGLSLAGREALVIGAGWIGAGVARGLARLDMSPRLVDRDPLKVMEARLNGLPADLVPRGAGRAALVVGATGGPSIGPDLMASLPDGAIVASASSRQIEIDVAWLRERPSVPVAEGVEAFAMADGRRLMLVNDGFPANFLPGSGSVADEIVETILGELIVLMRELTLRDFPPGVHRIAPEQEALCAALWLEMRDESLRGGA